MRSHARLRSRCRWTVYVFPFPVAGQCGLRQARTRAWARSRHCARRRRDTLMTLSDYNRINAPALAGDTAVAAHPPAQNHARAPCHRQVHRGSDKATRGSGPRLTAGKGIAAAGANRAIVTASRKAGQRENVLKGRSSVGADFQNAAVKPSLKIEVIPESYLYRLASFEQKNTGRVDALVADRGRI